MPIPAGQNFDDAPDRVRNHGLCDSSAQPPVPFTLAFDTPTQCAVAYMACSVDSPFCRSSTPLILILLRLATGMLCPLPARDGSDALWVRLSVNIYHDFDDIQFLGTPWRAFCEHQHRPLQPALTTSGAFAQPPSILKRIPGIIKHNTPALLPTPVHPTALHHIASFISTKPLSPALRFDRPDAAAAVFHHF